MAPAVHWKHLSTLEPTSAWSQVTTSRQPVSHSPACLRSQTASARVARSGSRWGGAVSHTWGAVICEEFEVAPPGSLPIILLGREEFFTKFRVNFLWHRNPPVFDVDPIT